MASVTKEDHSIIQLLNYSMIYAGIAQLVERQPSKLRVAGSSPVSRSIARPWARVAQSVEHFHGKEGVISSILIVGSILALVGQAGVTR